MNNGSGGRRRFLSSGAALFFLISSVSLSHAQQDAKNYPARPITLIVPFSPGGASDFAARILQPDLSKFLGQQVIVENRSGASGDIGMELAARAAPDGYTLFFGNVGTIAVNPAMFPKLQVKPLRDFIPISIAADAPGVMVANPQFPVATVAELIAYAKKKPGQTYASAGLTSINRLAFLDFAQQAKLKLIDVPFKGGAGPAIVDVIGDHVSLMITTVGSVINYIHTGRLKALAVTSAKRLPNLPKVPTLVEAGFPDEVSSSWQGVFAPKGTPPAIVEKIRMAIQKSIQDKDVKTRMDRSGVSAVYSSSPEDFARFVQKDSARWKSVVDRLGIATR